MRRRDYSARIVRQVILTATAGVVCFAPVRLLAQSRAASARPAPDLSTAIAQVAKRSIPAVVHIDVTQRQDVVEQPSLFDSDPFFQFFPGGSRAPRKFQRELRGLGTGMVIDERGHVLTNNHVVAGATLIEVVMADGNRHRATLVGRDPKTDLAVVKIPASPSLPHLTLGDSDKAEVGDWVIAIGHPRGLDQTVTQGIISAKHRHGITDPTGYQDFIQTDAAINPGNSGGPLLNLYGEVIGVNAAIATQSGGSEGIGFAIPSNMALHVARALIASGKVERGWLGVSVDDLTPERVKSLGLPAPKGALIAEVAPGGPAERSGLKRRDVVLSVGGRAIEDGSDLRNAIAGVPAGSDLTLTVWRSGAKQEVVVRTGSMQEATSRLAATVRERLGVSVRAVTQVEARRYGLSSREGVAIQTLDPKGALAQAGLEALDLLLEADGQSIGGVDGFASWAATLRSGQQITLLAVDHRTGQTGDVRVIVP
jgi:serine protease Do